MLPELLRIVKQACHRASFLQPAQKKNLQIPGKSRPLTSIEKSLPSRLDRIVSIEQTEQSGPREI